MAIQVEDLEQIVKEVELYFQELGLIIFYGNESSESHCFANIEWADDNWKGFLQSIKEIGAKMIVCDIGRFGKNVWPSLDEEEQRPQEVPEELRKYIGNICQFNLMWFKDGVKYHFTQRTHWWENTKKGKRTY